MPYGVDAVEQFQVVTSGGQAELGRALGGYVNVVTKSGTNALRGTAYGYFRDDAFNAANALSGTTLPMSQQQFGGSLGGPIAKDRTFYFANVEQRRLDQTGLTTISDANVAIVNARLAAVGLPGLAGHDRHLSEPGRQPQRARQDRSPVQRPRSVQRPLQPLRRHVRELARRRRAERAVGVGRPRQPRPGDRVQQHADAVAADGERNPRAVRLQRPAGAADRSDRSGGQHCRRRLVRHVPVEPAGPPEQDVPDRRTTCRISAARTRCAPASTSSTTTT